MGLVEHVAPYWSAKRTAGALLPTDQELTEQRNDGLILGITMADGVVLYPIVQFEQTHNEIRVRPGLQPLFQALRNRDPWTVGIVMRTPARELDDQTPLDWVRANGDSTRLINYAEIVNAEYERP